MPCPGCGSAVDWVDFNVAGGVQFDYFRSCANGCGQYCFDHTRKRFVRLR